MLDASQYSPLAAKKDGSTELYDRIRLRIVQPGGLFFFCKGIIGFPDLTPRAHYGLTLFYEEETILSKLVEFPKSHLKTSIGTIGNLLHKFARTAIAGLDPYWCYAIASNTKTNAKRMLRLVMVIVENNTLFQHFVPELMPEFSNEDVWNREEITFPRIRASTDPSIDTIGVGGAATSRHYHGIIEDDMLAEEDIDSPTAIRKAVELHQYYTSLLIDDDCWFLTNEHAWTEYDLNKHIVDNEPDTAVLSAGASQGYNFERSRLVPERIRKHFRLWDDGECVWPDRYGREALRKRRQKVGARIYNAVYENNPYDPEVIDFKESWIRYYEIDARGDIRIPPQRGVEEMEIVKRNSLNVVAAYDPALSKKSDAARSALVIVGVDPMERVFVLDVMAKREDPLKLIDGILHRCVHWKVQQCAVETVLFQKVLYDVIRDRCESWNMVHEQEEHIFSGVFREIKPAKGKEKEARIRTLVGTAFESGRVYLLSGQTDFIDEYLHFPIGKTVDILDAFTHSASLWVPGETEEEVEDYHINEQAWLSKRNPVTGY